MTGISDAFEKALNIGRIGNAMMFAQRSPAQHGPFLLIAGLCGAGTVLSVVALLRFYETIFRPDLAALMTALAVFAVAFLYCVVSKLVRKYKIRTQSQAGMMFEQDIKDLVGMVSDGLVDPIKDNPKMAVLIATVAGFLVARAKQ